MTTKDYQLGTDDCGGSETTITPATEWAGSSYATEARATRACVADWLTGGKPRRLTASDLDDVGQWDWDADAIGWFSREEDADGLPVVGGLSRVSDLAEVLAIAREILAEMEVE